MRKKVQKISGGATMKIAVQKTVFDGKEYYFFPFGWRVFFVTPELVKEDEGGNYIEFPLLNKCDLKKLSGDIIIITEGTKTLLITTFESVQVETKIETNAEHYINYKYDKLIIVDEDSTEIEETRVTTEVLILTEAEKIMIEWSKPLDYPDRGVRLLYTDEKIEELPYASLEILEKLEKINNL